VELFAYWQVGLAVAIAFVLVWGGRQALRDRAGRR
jgi:hypothetical protein